MIFSGFGVLVFSGFAMYDFQRIKSFPEDRYIDAALHLYLDIFNLFIFVLRLILSQRS
jgi:FtsH-binding integral membrane protein